MVRSVRIKDPRTLGNVLREARMASGMTQRELADELGVNQPYIVELESGKGTKAIERLLEFAQATGITIYCELEPRTSGEGHPRAQS